MLCLIQRASYMSISPSALSTYTVLQYALTYLMVFEALKAIANTDQSGAFRTLSKFHVKYGYSHSVRTGTQNHNKQLAAQILDINCLCLGR